MKPILVSIQELDNSLEYLVVRGGMGVHAAALYVTTKSFLGTTMNNQVIIGFFDSKQETDGAWTDVATRMFTTQRVLGAYYLLNATPKRGMDSFFSKYSTYQEVKDYLLYDRKSDFRDAYHIIFAWCLYYWQYPPWLNTFFAEVETDLDWTTGTDYHKRTHILYSYVIARRQFPNLDGIIDVTINSQQADGSWPDTYVVTKGRPVYNTSIQLSLLQQILKLYPDHRTNEIQTAITKSASWVNSQYKTQVLNGKTCGYFGDVVTLEDSLFCGILAAGQNGLLETNVDMTYADIVQRLQQPSGEIPFWLIAILELAGIGVLSYYLAKH